MTDRFKVIETSCGPVSVDTQWMCRIEGDEMAVMLEGPYRYETLYVVEHEEGIYGPFGCTEATVFALERFEPPFTIRPLYRPLQGAECPRCECQREGGSE